MGSFRITNWKCKGVPRGQGEELGFRRGDIDNTWMDIKVPGSIQHMLIDRGLIKDPRYSPDPSGILNDVSQQEWWYVTFLPSVKAGEKVFLCFEGLNTHAHIWVNGISIAETNDMFMSYQFEISQYLRPVDNSVAVCLDAGKLVKQVSENLWGLFNTERLYIRKMQMDWGWDFVPYIGSIGIWRPVILKTGTPDMISDLCFHTLSLADGCATIEITAELAGWIDGDKLVIEMDGLCQEVAANDFVRTVLQIENPKLWWPHDIGQPYLYQLNVSLKRKNELISNKTLPVGIRTIQLLQQPIGGEGLSFCFCINNRPVYCKGANWVPIDAFPGDGKERYQKLLDMTRGCGMNMLRVWGGGIYEDETFYTQCDQLGIMVWQDFAYTCGTYPDNDEKFCALIRDETKWIVKTLRKHPSIVLWCGNNECDWKYVTHYWDTPGHQYLGYKIFHQILPSVCAELDEDRPYWPSSPSGGPEPNSKLAGDTHNWHVWHGLIQGRRYWEKPNFTLAEDMGYKAYLQDNGKFISEFGIQGSPALATLTKYWGEINLDLLIKKQNKLDAERHQRLIEIHLGKADNPVDYCLRSMMTQAEGLKIGIEHFRRRKFNCSGCLIWQLNDSWPGFSWSLIDYDGIPKAAYYYIRRAYAPKILSWEISKDKAILWGINDTDLIWKGTICYGWYSLDSKQQRTWQIETDIPGNSAVTLGDLPLKDITDPQNVFLLAEAKNNELKPAVEYMVNPRYLRLEEPKITVTREGESIKIKADKFVSFFHFQEVTATSLSDNYFNLLPGRDYVIQGNFSALNCYNYYLPQKKGNKDE